MKNKELAKTIEIKQQLKALAKFREAYYELSQVWEGNYSNLNNLKTIENYSFSTSFDELNFKFLTKIENELKSKLRQNKERVD